MSWMTTLASSSRPVAAWRETVRLDKVLIGAGLPFPWRAALQRRTILVLITDVELALIEVINLGFGVTVSVVPGRPRRVVFWSQFFISFLLL